MIELVLPLIGGLERVVVIILIGRVGAVVRLCGLGRQLCVRGSVSILLWVCVRGDDQSYRRGHFDHCHSLMVCAYESARSIRFCLICAMSSAHSFML